MTDRPSKLIHYSVAGMSNPYIEQMFKTDPRKWEIVESLHLNLNLNIETTETITIYKHAACGPTTAIYDLVTHDLEQGMQELKDKFKYWRG